MSVAFWKWMTFLWAGSSLSYAITTDASEFAIIGPAFVMAGLAFGGFYWTAETLWKGVQARRDQRPTR